jgi:hypothetical protein
VRDASPEAVNRMVCYCDDCQAYAHRLGRADLLDAQGGTDVVQIAPASLLFEAGEEHIAGLRLSPKGLYRWYATCCNTPLGNTVGPAFPFVGIVKHVFEHDGQTADDLFGSPVGKSFGKFAVGTPPEGSTKPNFRLLGRAIGKVVGWKLGGKTWPHPFFDRTTGAPRRPITIVPPAEREALRAYCGPRPTAR